MSDIAISLRGLTKAYRLYKNSSDKALGIFNIRLGRFGAYTEHLAIDHMDLDIRRGERVGIIGRNGSGKSTLLKLISRTTTPTSGMLEVRGDIHVLMNLGTGFHPEFTGRENAYAYLAQIGIRGSRAEALVEELATFAEIGQYFDQPLATYSSGMQVRLMFAAATVVSPDILLLDEVLGVGDAYFIHKSFARLRALCTREATTLLLVTHSPHMAAEICNRLVWIDGGRVMMDGEPMGVINAYEASIRDQEERRLRQMNEYSASGWTAEVNPTPPLPERGEAVTQDRSIPESASQKTGNASTEATPRNTPDEANALAAVLSGQLQTVADQVPVGRLYISAIRVCSDERELAALDFENPARTSNVRIVDDNSKGDWGPLLVHEGRRARQYMRYGSVFHKLPFLMNLPGLAASVEELSAEVTYWTDVPEQMAFSLFHPDGNTRSFGTLDLSQPKQWSAIRGHLNAGMAAEPDNRARYGTRRIEITDFQIYNGDGKMTSLFEIGESMRVRIDYRVNDPALDERPTFMVGFHRDGLQCTHRIWTEGFHVSADENASGCIEAIASPLLLGPGRYTTTVMIVEEGHLTTPGFKPYFTISEHLHDMHARAQYIEVSPRDSGNPLYYDFVFQHPSRWICNGIETSPSLFIGDKVVLDDHIYVAAPRERQERKKAAG